MSAIFLQPIGKISGIEVDWTETQPPMSTELVHRGSHLNARLSQAIVDVNVVDARVLAEVVVVDELLG